MAFVFAYPKDLMGLFYMDAFVTDVISLNVNITLYFKSYKFI